MSAPYVGIRPPVIRREERRRRVLLFAIVAALLLGITPVVGHHVLGAVRWLSAEQQHLAMLCLVALHQLLAPVHSVAQLYARVGYAVLERGRAFWRHFSAAVVTDAYNWRRVLPALGQPIATSRLLRSSLVELGAALLVLTVTAVLVATPMPGE